METILAEAQTHELIFNCIGGLALFMFGMELLGNGLKMASGDKLRSMLQTATGNRFTGVATGMGVTAIIQSSSATTVIVVGLINAGLMKLRQAIGVILGANIGTTATIWIVAFVASAKGLKISSYALVMVAIGFVFQTFLTHQKYKTLGTVLLGLGLLFIGLEFMKDAVPASLFKGENAPLVDFLKSVTSNPILAMLAGALVTMIVQSSSASMSIVVMIASQGGFGNQQEALTSVLPIILGANIGTTITAQLASLNAGRAAKRAAMAHTLFNVIGSVVMLLMITRSTYFADASTKLWAMVRGGVDVTSAKGGETQFLIATAHTMFNVLATLVFLPFVSQLAWVIERLIPITKAETELRPVTLEEHLLDTPSFALQQVRGEIVRMANMAASAMTVALDGLNSRNMKVLKIVQAKEEATDEFQDAITNYLVKLATRNLPEEIAEELPVLMHSVNDIERIGDHAVNIAEIAHRKNEKNHPFGGNAEMEIGKMRGRVDRMFEHIINALEQGDPTEATLALQNEGEINQMLKQYRRNHVKRLHAGDCHALSGLLFVDTIQNLEKIGDHLTNVAQAFLGGLHWDSPLEIDVDNPDDPDEAVSDGDIYGSEELIEDAPAEQPEAIETATPDDPQ